MHATAVSSAPPFSTAVLPVPASSPERPLEDRQTASIPLSAPPAKERHKAPRHSILLVEDDPTIRAFVHRILSNCGFHVDVATNGEEGWEALQQRPYDLLLTDHEMPLLKGLDLISRLRRQALPVRVILMSGVIPSGAILHSDHNAPDAFLQKPFSIIALVTEIENQLLAER